MYWAACQFPFRSLTPSPSIRYSRCSSPRYHRLDPISDLINQDSRRYLQLRLPDVEKPSFLAIASPPSQSASTGAFEFLVKKVAGSTAELLCGLKKGDVVELTQAMGNGFNIDKIDPPEDYPTVLIFATGSGISPIRSLIESGFGADKRSDVGLYFGARNLRRMAYQDRFKDWESSGVKIVPVLSQPDDSWTGESGYVQAAFARAKQIHSPKGTGAVICGQIQMTEKGGSRHGSGEGTRNRADICMRNQEGV
ncbi:pKIWI502 protein [Hibiscus syriacus]|uniref:PKIWI502 protein n=1 Tax=Hibiscus syriacus TaxID=106335 RepID=A0A6A3CSC8_HIBSY|nr:pKIWI502 protein [Hibiscus syriacus]